MLTPGGRSVLAVSFKRVASTQHGRALNAHSTYGRSVSGEYAARLEREAHAEAEQQAQAGEGA